MLKKGSQDGIVFKNAQLVIEREDIQEAVKKIRDKWNIPPKGFRSINKHHNWFINLTNQLLLESYGPSKYSLFLQEVSENCKSLHLPIFWTAFLIKYVSTGEIKDSYNPRSGITYNTPLISVVSKDKQELKIRLEFGANTKKKDIMFVWPKVLNLQKTLPDYDHTRNKRKLKLVRYIAKQLKEGKTQKEIYEELPYNFGYPEKQAVLKTIQRTRKLIKGH